MPSEGSPSRSRICLSVAPRASSATLAARGESGRDQGSGPSDCTLSRSQALRGSASAASRNSLAFADSVTTLPLLTLNGLDAGKFRIQMRQQSEVLSQLHALRRLPDPMRAMIVSNHQPVAEKGSRRNKPPCARRSETMFVRRNPAGQWVDPVDTVLLDHSNVDRPHMIHSRTRCVPGAVQVHGCYSQPLLPRSRSKTHPHPSNH